MGLCKLLWKDWYWLLLLMMTTGRLLVGGMWSTGCAWLGLWMACLSRAGAGQVSMTGVDGLLPALDCQVFFGQYLFSYFRLPSLSSGARVRPR